MTIQDIRSQLQSASYDFLSTNPHLGKQIILLGLGGSHAYGTNVETSDVDIRGCALNSKREILTNENFEQFTDSTTDTVIYSFNKLISLLCNCNPNVVEMLGLKPEHYLQISPVGRELLNHRHLFLSRKAIHSFGGYATSQLRRLDNKAARHVDQPALEQHILNSIRNASVTFKDKYCPMNPTDHIDLYIDQSEREDYESEIYMDVQLTRYPLRDYKDMWSEMQNIVKDYAKIGRRNMRAASHDKLAKHMMHLVRLYLMCFDILEQEEIVTYRAAERDFLLEIRAGRFLDAQQQPTSEFFDLVAEYEQRLEYAKRNTSLPEQPKYKQIQEFVMSVNERIVKGLV